jgi:DNA (cytosine-5)-methyltransferase 1
MTALTVGALFAGYGGLELGLSQVLETDLRWVAEFDRHPSKILAHHWPDAPNLGDVTVVDWAAVEPVDVITGGSPCQDLSHAGKRAGMKPGTRSGLWAAMCRAIDELRPSLVVWENVRGALSAEASCEMEPEPRPVGTRSDGPVLRALGRVLGDLAELGYDAGWCGLRAADLGAPHGRYRIFVVAWPAAGDADSVGLARVGAARIRRAGPENADLGVVSLPADDELLPTPNPFHMGNADEAPDEWRARRVDVHERTGTQHGPALSVVVASLFTDDPLTPATYLPRDQRLPTPTAADAARSGSGKRGTTLTDALTRNQGMLLPTPNVIRGAAGQTYAQRAGHQVDVGDVVAEGVIGVAPYFGPYTAAVRRWEIVHGHPAPLPTETTRASGLARLSPKFVEWMMGLPPGWVTRVPGISANQQLSILGNGVVPVQAAAAISHVLRTAAAS